MAQVFNGTSKGRLVRQLDPDHHSQLREDAVALRYVFVNVDPQSTSFFSDQHGHGGRCSHTTKWPSAIGAKDFSQNARYIHKRKLSVAGEKEWEEDSHPRKWPPAHGARDFTQNAFLSKKTSDTDEDEADSDSGSEEEKHSNEGSTSSKMGLTPSPTTLPLSATPGVEEKKKWECPKPDFLHVCFFVINVFFVIMGALLLALGLVLIYNAPGFNAFTKNLMTGRLANVDFAGVLSNGSIGMIISGVITLILGLIGTVGVTSNNIHIMHTYAGLISAAIAIQIIGVLYAFIKRGDIFDNIKKSLLENMREHYDGLKNSSSLFSQSMDAAQVYFECCGINGWKDFQDTPWYRWVNNLPEPTSPPTTYNPCPPAENVTRNATDRNANATAGGNDTYDDYDQFTTTPCIFTTVIITEPTTDYAETTEQLGPAGGKWINIPDTCCKTVLGAVLSLTEGNVELLDPDCPTKNASVTNPNSAVGCFDTIKTFLFNQAN